MLIRKLCIRNLFWLILAIPAYQMLMFSAGGCSLLFTAGENNVPEEAATGHNGYTCECGYDVDDIVVDEVVITDEALAYIEESITGNKTDEEGAEKGQEAACRERALSAVVLFVRD